MKKTYIIKISRTPLDGRVYIKKLTYKDNRVYQLEQTCDAKDALQYPAIKDAEFDIKTIKFLDPEWEDYYFEIIDAQKEIEETDVSRILKRLRGEN